MSERFEDALDGAHETEMDRLRARLAAAESACREAKEIVAYFVEVIGTPMPDPHDPHEECADCKMLARARAVLAGEGEAKDAT